MSSASAPEPDLNAPSDFRLLRTGRPIPAERYSDQPYLVRTDDDAWLCVLTTGKSVEHVVAQRSLDQGRTWRDGVSIEPAGGPEASYAVLIKAPGGRIFVFYNYNADNLRDVRADDPPYPGGRCQRVDSLGQFVFKFSDDHGRTWSAERYPVPMRETAIDRGNPYGGKVRFFWNVGRPFVHGAALHVPLHKVGGFGHGFFVRSEGWFLRSATLLSAADPGAADWETLPDGDTGLTAPAGGGPIAEEQSVCVLSDGTFYAVWRSVDGHPVTALSRDGGHSWTQPEYQSYADGRLMKHPRAANFIWRCANGKYLYWFHNHGGKSYEDRNPAWLCGGIERDTCSGRTIAWSQPEILLYDDDPFVRISYPDLIEENGQTFITETQKTVPRVHQIDPILLSGLWGQFAPAGVAREGLVLAWRRDEPASARKLAALPDFLISDETVADYGTKDHRNGMTLELWVEGSAAIVPGMVLASNRTAAGCGFTLSAVEGGAVELTLGDGRVENRWASDPGALSGLEPRHLVAIVDAGPKIVAFVTNGSFNDGGTGRQFGWGRFSPQLRSLRGADRLTLADQDPSPILLARVYARALRSSEAVGNYGAGPSG